jgi:UDP-N-acetylmuramate--alanine ligase
MSGLAFLLARRGFAVDGCDAGRGGLAGWLECQGIVCRSGHDAGHVADGVDWVVRSPAVREDCAELEAARALGLPVVRRGEVLPRLLDGRLSVAVGGTHGKTSTSMFVTQILKSAGREPAWCIGGEAGGLGVAGDGWDGADFEGSLIVVEADESDGSLALYRPEIGVVTNIDFDHMEHFESEADFVGCFERFVAGCRRRVWYCDESELACDVCGGLGCGLSYGFGADAFLRGECVGGELGVWRGGEFLGRLELVLPGRHNALNLLAAVGVVLDLGLDFDEVRRGAAGLVLPRRRFEQVAELSGARVISDYAHHPVEVAALVRTARGELGYGGRLLVVFQPHRYTRTLALGGDFPGAFAGVDVLVLTPVYAASEAPLRGGMVEDLYARFREFGGVVPLLAEGLEAAWDFLRGELAEGDVVLVVGAGDVERVAEWARAEAGELL